MTRTFSLAYRHYPSTARPHYVGASEVAQVASSLRRQLGLSERHLKVDVAHVIERVRQLEVNGVCVKVDWGLGAAVTDETGVPALGSCEYDLAAPDHALVYLNTDEIGGREYLERSTGVHELGHGIFDAPGWIVAHAQGRLGLKQRHKGGTRVFRIVTPGEEHLRNSRSPVDWQEFRANAFMGAFLAPADALRRALFQLSKKLNVPLIEDQPALPGLGTLPLRADFTGVKTFKVEALVWELAEAFGLSPSFIQVRLNKYVLVRGPPRLTPFLPRRSTLRAM